MDGTIGKRCRKGVCKSHELGYCGNAVTAMTEIEEREGSPGGGRLGSFCIRRAWRTEVDLGLAMALAAGVMGHQRYVARLAEEAPGFPAVMSDARWCRPGRLGELVRGRKVHDATFRVSGLWCRISNNPIDALGAQYLLPSNFTLTLPSIEPITIPKKPQSASPWLLRRSSLRGFGSLGGRRRLMIFVLPCSPGLTVPDAVNFFMPQSEIRHDLA